MLCQICGARAREIYKEDLVAEAPWDLWVAILVFGSCCDWSLGRSKGLLENENGKD